MDKQTFEYMKTRIDSYQRKETEIKNYEKAIKRLEEYTGRNLSVNGNLIEVPRTLFPIMAEHIKETIQSIEKQKNEI